MPSHEKDLKDDNGESKVIMIWSSLNAFIGPNILKLRRLMGCRADFTQPSRAINRYLIRITINQVDRGFIANKKIFLLHISNYVTEVVNNRKGSRSICGAVDQKLPTGGREFL